MVHSRLSELTIGSRTVIVRELSVKQVRGWMSDADKKGEQDIIASMLFDDCDFSTIAIMTDLSVDEMGDMLPSELRTVVKECQAVNSHFFGMARRMGLLLEGMENKSDS